MVVPHLLVLRMDLLLLEDLLDNASGAGCETAVAGISYRDGELVD